MALATNPDLPAPAGFSPLMLIDRLIALAEEADRAGMERAAGSLLRLAFSVGDDPSGLTRA